MKICMTNILSGKWIFDSNLLIYSLNLDSPFHEKTSQLFLLATENHIQIAVAQQNILETHKALIRVYHRTPNESVNALENMLSTFISEVIHPQPQTLHRYHMLLAQAQTTPIDLFDYYLAATMLDSGINRILTVNTKDFNLIPGIEAVNPFV